MTALAKPFFVTLTSRAVIRAGGAEAYDFLQNMISNDMALLEIQPMIYACLLTPQGKFLFDFFITRDNDDYLIECEGGERAEALLKKLTMYRLRSNVDLTLENNKPVYIIIGTDQPHDPRDAVIGHRTFIKPDLEEKAFEVWDQLRIRRGIPDGSRDMEVEKSTLIESRIDVLNGISFTKGCYVGQEITARMHNLGIAKKHLIPVRITGTAPAPGSDVLKPDGHLAGEMRSSCGDLGLALLKDEALESLKNGPIQPLNI